MRCPVTGPPEVDPLDVYVILIALALLFVLLGIAGYESRDGVERIGR